MTKTIQTPGVTLPEIDDVTRREFLIGIAGLLLFPAACGSNEGGDASGETRTIEHAAGTTDVPANPRRVVPLDEVLPPSLIALGFTPAGLTEDAEGGLEDVAELLPDDLNIEDIERIGEGDEVNLETIATIEPDLILGTDLNEEIYDQLSEIAPTVLVERGGNGDWRRRFRDVAGALGRMERAEEAEADYERLISELPEGVKESTVAFIRSDNGQFRIDGIETAFAGSVAEDAGIPSLAPEGVGEVEEESGYIAVSGEQLGVVEEADLIVTSEESIPQFEQSALWKTLPAVQQGRVVPVPILVYNGGTHYAAELLLREIEQALA